MKRKGFPASTGNPFLFDQSTLKSLEPATITILAGHPENSAGIRFNIRYELIFPEKDLHPRKDYTPVR